MSDYGKAGVIQRRRQLNSIQNKITPVDMAVDIFATKRDDPVERAV